jgi:hypothetical protein
MPSENGDPGDGSSGRPARFLLIAGTFAAGAATALAAKALLDSRREGGSPGHDSDEDLATVLRRAALDVALAATNRAAERLEPS